MKLSLRIIKTSLDKKYTQLLISLVITFVISTFLIGGIGRIILSFIFLYTMVTIVKTFSVRAKILRIYSFIALFVFTLEVLINLNVYIPIDLAVIVFIQLVYILYLGVGASLILRDIAFSRKVTIDTILGSLCIYFLIGILWAFIYKLCATFDPNAFTQPILEDETFRTVVYFSFTTLTTVGYGDIAPASSIARMLTNLEAIIGQMYPAIIVSILVSIYTSQRVK